MKLQIYGESDTQVLFLYDSLSFLEESDRIWQNQLAFAYDKQAQAVLPLKRAIRYIGEGKGWNTAKVALTPELRQSITQMLPVGQSTLDLLYKQNLPTCRLVRIAVKGDLIKYIFAYGTADGQLTALGYSAVLNTQTGRAMRFSDWFWRSIWHYDQDISGVQYQAVKNYKDIDIDLMLKAQQATDMGSYLL